MTDMKLPTMNDVLQAKFIGELPDSNEQWSLCVTQDGVVVAINNDHPPHAIVDGKLVKVHKNFTTEFEGGDLFP